MTTTEDLKLRLSHKILFGFFLVFFLIALIVQGILAFIGLILVLYGSLLKKTEISTDKKSIEEKKQELISTSRKGWLANFVKMSENQSFLLLFFGTLIFLVVFAFNVLTYASDGTFGLPNGPFYQLRETELQNMFPLVPVDVLETKSTFGSFGLVMDFVILLVLSTIIYIRIKPGYQYLEKSIEHILTFKSFLVILMLAIFYHSYGHLYLEKYGLGQWNSGFETLQAWITFDKGAHMLASAAFTVLIAILVVYYFKKKNEATKLEPPVDVDHFYFMVVVTFALVIMGSVLWEFAEWIYNSLASTGHFVDEVLDSPKDLVWDTFGAIFGLLISIPILKESQERKYSIPSGIGIILLVSFLLIVISQI